MEIKYLGHASFLIKTKTSKLVTDPYDSNMVGLKFPRTEADIVTVSHQHGDHNAYQQIVGVGGVAPLVIDMPGEFEKMQMRIFGFKSFHDDVQGAQRGENNLYKIEAEGVSILHCGDLGIIPDDSFLDAIGDVDILMVPVGGFYTIDSEKAVELVKKVEPAIVIPMHFGNPDMKNKDILNKLAPVTDFTKKFGIDNPQKLPKLVTKKEDLVEGEMKVIVLES